MALAESSVTFQEERKNGILVLRIKGRLDAVSAPSAEKKVFDLINNGETKIILNLANVDYLSSAGMRMLLSTAKKMKGISGKFVLSNVNNSVMDILKMSGFDHVLEITGDENEAARRF